MCIQSYPYIYYTIMCLVATNLPYAIAIIP